MRNPSLQVGLIHGSAFEIVEGVQYLSMGSLHNAHTGAVLLLDGTVERLICSGRGPVDGVAYRLTEAQLMADHLVREGVPHARIEIEDTSTSTLGNWVNSAALLQEIDADGVIGITGRPTLQRARMIGDFVAARSDFALTDYIASASHHLPKDYVREAIMTAVTRRFLADKKDTPLDQLDAAYSARKGKLGLDFIKKTMHRRGSAASSADNY